MALKDDLHESPLIRELEAIGGGKKSLPGSEAKRHHLIPEFLLRRFSRRREGRDRVLQLDIGSGKPTWADPETAASRRRFYSVPDEDGGRSNQFEGYFALVEGHAAPAIERLCSDPKRLEVGDRATLAFFVAVLEGRTLGGLDRIERLGEVTMKAMLAGHMQDEAAFAESYRGLFGDANAETIEEFRGETLQALADGRAKVSEPRVMALDLLQRALGDTFQIVFQLRWELLGSDEGAFITSDRGLAMHDPTPQYPWSGHAWLSSPNAEATIPIDPHFCLRLSPSPHGPTRQFDARTASSGQVHEVNLRTYGFASTYVFSHNQEVATSVHRMAKRRPGSLVTPRPNHMVMLIEMERGDARLADEHVARGWPPYLEYDGQPHDYVVLDSDDNPVEKSVDLSRLGKERAIRHFGTSEVREKTMSVDPRRIR